MYHVITIVITCHVPFYHANDIQADDDRWQVCDLHLHVHHLIRHMRGLIIPLAYKPRHRYWVGQWRLLGCAAVVTWHESAIM